MRQTTLHYLLIATSLVLGTAVVSIGQDLRTSQVLPNHTRCDHVVSLVHLHGVNNSVDLASGYNLQHHGAFGSFAIPGAEMGDLEVVSISRIEHVAADCGPRIAVCIRNNSHRDVCHFHVSAVAIFGHIHGCSPSATVKVEKICAGEIFEVHLDLPIEALAMGNRNGCVVGFTKLIVAIDSFDVLAETNEANNIKAIAAGAIPLVAVTTESVSTQQVVEPVVDQAPPAPAPNGEAINQTVSPEVAATAPQGNGASAQPQTPDALRSAIQMLDTQSASN